jgi:transposase
MLNFFFLPNWTVTKVERTAEKYVATAAYEADRGCCPGCGTVGQLGKHGTKRTEYRDAPVHGRPSVISVDRRRYRCRACGATSLQPLPDMDEKRRMTTRCVEYIGNQAWRRTFTQIAGDVGIDEKTVRIVASEKIVEADAARTIITPRRLGIDEVTVLSKPRAIFTDIEQRRVVDLMETRSKPSVARWLQRLPNRDRVQAVTIGMWAPYRDAVRAVLPTASIVVDKFHVVRMADQAVDLVRKKAGNDLTVKNRRKLMRSRHLLLRRHRELKPIHRMDLDAWLKNVPALQDAYQAKERLYDIWESSDKATARGRYHHWFKTLPLELDTAFRPLLTAMQNWEPEILAYWDHPITNGGAEAANGILKNINQTGRGYSFPVMRARILEMQGRDQKTFICDECLGEYPSFLRSRSHRYDGALCANCHRIHTDKWFKRHGTST